MPDLPAATRLMTLDDVVKYPGLSTKVDGWTSKARANWQTLKVAGVDAEHGCPDEPLVAGDEAVLVERDEGGHPGQRERGGLLGVVTTARSLTPSREPPGAVTTAVDEVLDKRCRTEGVERRVGVGANCEEVDPVRPGPAVGLDQGRPGGWAGWTWSPSGGHRATRPGPWHVRTTHRRWVGQRDRPG